MACTSAPVGVLGWMRALGRVTESVHDRYTYVEAAAHLTAAQQVAALVPKAGTS
jgi:hypothetical protein